MLDQPLLPSGLFIWYEDMLEELLVTRDHSSLYIAPDDGFDLIPIPLDTYVVYPKDRAEDMWPEQFV